MSDNKKQIYMADRTCLPNHVGIIMDGNGRWAKKRGLPRTAGHNVGVKVLKNLVYYAKDMGLKNLTVYAFSTENWKRPQSEINVIMSLLDKLIDDSVDELLSLKVRIRFIGEPNGIAPELLKKIDHVTELSKDYTDTTLNIALNYGGQQEIAKAAKEIAIAFKNGEITEEDITPDLISKHLYFEDFSSVDLIIRPSGELRLSNFLLWQSAYSEYWFSDVLWPDFKPEHLERAIYDYQQRHRRFGGL